MPRKLKLAYKKHGSVKPKPQDVSEEGYLSGVAHSSTQTDQASETMSTQTDSVDTCDVPIQTDKKNTCNVSSQTDKKDTSNVSSQTDKKDTCDVAIQTAKEQPSDQPNLLTPLPFSATVKVDIDLFYSLGIVDINQLQRRLSCMKCIYGNWFLVPARLEADKLQIVRLSQQQLQCSFVVEVFEDLKWSLQLPSQQLSPSTSLVLKHLPEAVTSVFVLRSVLMFLDQCTICQGNPDPKFAPIVAHSKGIFKDRSGLKVNAYFDQKTLTIRHVSCYWLLSDCTKDRCPVCVQYRESFLRSKLRSVLDDTKQDGSEASSHVNHRYLDTPTKLRKIKNLQSLVRKQNRQIKTLQEKLRIHIQTSGIKLNNDAHDELSVLMQKYGKSVIEEYGEDSFQSVFWMQQMKALTTKSKTHIRWHPVIIRWALYLHYKSSGAYVTLRKSGVISLPTARTLRDYRHFSSHCQVGFTGTCDHQLLDLIKQRRPSHLARYVFLLIDEMYIKEGLVYEKSTGALVGFSDLGGAIQQLNEYEHLVAGNGQRIRQLAKTMMVIMVSGVFTDIAFPYAQFPMASPKGSDLFPLIWRAVDRLECNSIEVLGVTCDGASINRRMLKLHGNSYTYKTTNIYSSDGRSLLFFIDPPHLLKTIRNGFANPSRKLWCNGQPIKWQFVRDVYDKNLGNASNVGVSLVHKLTLEHLNLNSFSKMRVDLAAQVMSSTVSSALLYTRDSEVFETAHFIEKVDKFFDSLNVSNFTQGKHSRKPFQEPYRDADDARLKFLKEFLLYLKAWQTSVNKLTGYDEKEKKMMVLPKETTSGIHITVSSFVELISYLFKIPGVRSFLSYSINQDPLEKYFGIQRQAGKSNENPTVSQFVKNTDTIRVIRAIWLDDIKGNCRGHNSKKHVDFEAAKIPLQKRQRRKSF